MANRRGTGSVLVYGPGPLVRDDPRSAPRGQPRLEKIKTGERDFELLQADHSAKSAHNPPSPRRQSCNNRAGFW